MFQKLKSLKTLLLTTVSAVVLGAPHISAQEAVIGQSKSVLPTRQLESAVIGRAKIQADIDDFRIIYGPTAEEAEKVVSSSGRIMEVYQTLGAPYSVDNVGEMQVYRWGNGTTEVIDGRGSIVRNELLVFAGKDGSIEGFSYKNKANVTGLEPLQMIAAGNSA
ncbi:MAG: hypothetical protein WA957_16755 [Alteraurantiacibacter sp.]